ncbi:protein FAM193A isoform X1 [Neodiprion pinetum]|uniref:protein FAM193A isoform X1 n=1 Tax=Neodiprion pinetum TaxID=441929 RepID=UPI001EDCDA20|nr:uncharacterized protein LOC124222062 isoform X1 [Neodiprion pinetum]
MSDCNDEVDQREKRKSIEEAAMGDVLGKESSSKANPEKDTPSKDQGDEDGRKEADGASAVAVGQKSALNFPSTVKENSSVHEATENIDVGQDEDMASNELASVKSNAEDTIDGVTDMLVIPNSPLQRPKGPCSCDACKDRRELLTEQLEEVTRLQGLWMELRQHIRSVFRAATETSRVPHSSRLKYDKAHLENMHEIILQLCKRDPHQLFMRLEGQAQDFVMETKVRLLDLLHIRNASNLAEIFLSGLLDGYDVLLSAASHLSSLVEPLENEHLSKFNLTWDCLNKRLYQSCVYADPLVQNNLPPFIGQLRKLLPLKGAEYQGLVHRYLAFDDEMTRIGDMWPEAERLIDKYNQEQAALKAKQKMLREDWELFKARRKLIQQRMWNRTSNELTEFDEQLLTLATLGAVGALSPNSRPPSPNSDLGLDALNLPLDTDILESLAHDANKSTHLRLADMVGALTSTEVLTEINSYNIGPVTTLNGHYNEPEYWFGYECAVNHVLNYGFVTPPPSPRSGSPVSDERVDGEGSEVDIGGGDEQTCECHVCTVPQTSPTRIGKGPSLNLNLQTNNFNPFPPISNGLSGGVNCTAPKNGLVDMNVVYPHLYNLHAAFAAGPKKPNNPACQTSTSPGSKTDEKKSCSFGTPIKKKSEEISLSKKQLDEIQCAMEDTDLRETEPQPCPCVYRHAKEIVERKKEVLENPPCSCLLKSKQKWDTCPCLKKSRSDPTMTNGYGQPESLTIPAVKPTSASRKTTNRPSATQQTHIQTRHSTTQTPNITHNHNHLPHPGRCPTHSHSRGTLPDLAKGAAAPHRGHAHPNHVPHACHKQANIEHIKRVSCSDLGAGDGDCSDSGSSQEDSCSTSSSTPRDSSRHCDCCYCEVFGHGVPSVAPVSRNYNEMRERLRQLLTKKKAKKCKAACSPPKIPIEVPSSNSNTVPTSNVLLNQPVPRPNTPVSVTPVQHQNTRDQRDLEALLEFIEGNQNSKKDNKKAEKKARQRQKKLDEKLKKDQQEAEKQRIMELQKKTPEVTITVVDPQKPLLQRSLPQRTLPEVSILPASAPLITSTLKPSNKKKEKEDGTKVKSPPVHSNQKNKIGINVEKKDENVIAVSQKSKAATIIDKVDSSKSNISAPSKFEEKSEKKCKKERQKLKREAKAKEEALMKAAGMIKNQSENQPQIVTIKRVMESNNAEPTVTITLKGQTPAEDKVLFTLVNGQTKEPMSSKPEQPQSQKASGKKKKGKGNVNQQQQQQQQAKSNPVQQPSSSTNLKHQQGNINDNKNIKNQQTHEKPRAGKQNDDKKVSTKQQQQQQQNVDESKIGKSKKDKKNIENKENVMQQQNNTGNKSKSQQQQPPSNNKKCKVSAQSVTTPCIQKQQQQQNSTSDSINKKSKGQSQEKNNQTLGNKNKNSGDNNTVKIKNNNQKNQNTVSPIVPKPSITAESPNTATESLSSPLSNQFKDIGANPDLIIENLKLPPGITITKVNAPAKPMPIKSTPLSKPVNPPKQTTIIAAPMSGVQSNYATPQGAGNVIVVDTGKLKQDLLPKSNEKDSSKDNHQSQSTSGKKKKKKSNNKSSTNASGAVLNSVVLQHNAVNGIPLTNGHTDASARILHNPGSNMVTIRNPAFGPPKMEPTQQAAIIKVSENGMVTIRSPALQQAINAGLTPPAKPDFIVKGDLSSNKAVTQQNIGGKPNNFIPSSLAELRNRLTPDCTGLKGLANIQISKVTGGQPIPENGINLRGTSVTLTKVRSEAVMDNVQQAKTAVREAISATMAASSSGKGKKKKKKGNGTRQNGDDWNLVESVFTPKDIDLEDGEMDDAERELEAFKRFCLQSVPPARKEKVNLNIKDIVLKKKSTPATVIAAN